MADVDVAGDAAMAHPGAEAGVAVVLSILLADAEGALTVEVVVIVEAPATEVAIAVEADSVAEIEAGEAVVIEADFVAEIETVEAVVIEAVGAAADLQLRPFSEPSSFLTPCTLAWRAFPDD